jgi:hypothetical protein
MVSRCSAKTRNGQRIKVALARPASSATEAATSITGAAWSSLLDLADRQKYGKIALYDIYVD